jgi:hypothetical protein
MEANEFMRDLLSRYNSGGSYFDFESADVGPTGPNDVSTIGPGNRIDVYADNSPRYAIQFPVTNYYRDLLFCDHRNAGLGDENEGTEIPEDQIDFCSGLNQSSNGGFGFDEANGTTSGCRGSGTCYADRRDHAEPAFNLDTAPVRFRIRELPPPAP